MKKSRAARGRARHSATAAPNSGRPVGKIARREHGPAPPPFPAKSGHHPGAAVCGQVLILVCGPSLYISEGKEAATPRSAVGGWSHKFCSPKIECPPVAFAFALCFFWSRGENFVFDIGRTPLQILGVRPVSVPQKNCRFHMVKEQLRALFCVRLVSRHKVFALRRRLEPIEIYNRP